MYVCIYINTYMVRNQTVEQLTLRTYTKNPLRRAAASGRIPLLDPPGSKCSRWGGTLKTYIIIYYIHTHIYSTYYENIIYIYI